MGEDRDRPRRRHEHLDARLLAGSGRELALPTRRVRDAGTLGSGDRRAFAVNETPDPAITFSDLDPTAPAYRWAAIAVQRGWMTRSASGRFESGGRRDRPRIHRSLVRALGMGPTAATLNRLSTTDGYRFDTPRSFGVDLLAMRLGLRFNNRVDESQDVTPGTRLRRKQVRLVPVSSDDPRELGRGVPRGSNTRTWTCRG